MANPTFPNYTIPFPYSSLPAQLQASLQGGPLSNGSGYGRFNFVNNNAFGLAPFGGQGLFGQQMPTQGPWQPPWGNNNPPNLKVGGGPPGGGGMQPPPGYGGAGGMGGSTGGGGIGSGTVGGAGGFTSAPPGSMTTGPLPPLPPPPPSGPMGSGTVNGAGGFSAAPGSSNPTQGTIGGGANTQYGGGPPNPVPPPNPIPPLNPVVLPKLPPGSLQNNLKVGLQGGGNASTLDATTNPWAQSNQTALEPTLKMAVGPNNGNQGLLNTQSVGLGSNVGGMGNGQHPAPGMTHYSGVTQPMQAPRNFTPQQFNQVRALNPMLAQDMLARGGQGYRNQVMQANGMSDDQMNQFINSANYGDLGGSRGFTPANLALLRSLGIGGNG